MLGFSMSLSLPKVDVIDHAQFLLFICNMTLYSELRYYSSHSNLSLRTPLYYGQFVWSQKCQKSYIPYLHNTDTSVKRTLGSVPLMFVLKRFDCIESNVLKCSGQ